MREILFRGKYKRSGEWIYGFFHSSFRRDYIRHDIDYERVDSKGTNTHNINSIQAIQTVDVEIESNTVGQYVGLKDKNGNKIFEGDILSLKDEVGKKGIVTVGFEDGGFIVFKGLAWRYIGTFRNIENELEVVGNIHDNSGLYDDIKGELK